MHSQNSQYQQNNNYHQKIQNQIHQQQLQQQKQQQLQQQQQQYQHYQHKQQTHHHQGAHNQVNNKQSAYQVHQGQQNQQNQQKSYQQNQQNQNQQHQQSVQQQHHHNTSQQSNQQKDQQQNQQPKQQQQQIQQQQFQAKKEVQKPSSIVPKGKITFDCGGTPFIVDDKYEYIRQIGHGAYGVVCSAINKKTNAKVAIKKVGKAFEDLIDAKRIVREIKLLKFFDHENIISIIDLQRPETKTGYDDIYIITDLMETDLHRVIYSRQELTDEHIQYFVYQILRGILYMHSANVIHRDLKPSNLLLNKNCDLKICDLGLCRGYEQEDEFKTEYVVTRWYRAPEVILNASEYTKAVDIWSVGCILAELIGRTPLFPGEDYLDQVQRIIAVLGTPTNEDLRYIGNENALKYIKSLPKRSKQPWTNLYQNQNPQALDLLSNMLTFNPDDRFTVEECLNHPYFESIHNEEEEPICDRVFDWSWDSFKPTKEILQGMVYDESLCFHPLPQQQQNQQQQQQQQFNPEKLQKRHI